ncbi:MAG: transglycosylase SLT domain-containing protein [Pseudomonadota bacterium]
MARRLSWVFSALLCCIAVAAVYADGPRDADAPDPALRSLLIAAAADAASFGDRFDAEVWLADMSNRLRRKVPDDATRLEWLKLIHREATRAHLPPELVLAVIDIESNFDRFAISRAGALGMMQIMPFWLDEIGRPDDNLFHVPTNLRMGCTILRYYIDMENGNLATGLARYNGSYGRRTYSDKVLRRLRERWYKG